MKKRKHLRKTILLLPLMAAIGLVFTACSSDDEKTTPVPDEPTVELDADTIKVYDNIGVKFQLLNSRNQAVTSFKQGENIIFKLVITNDRKNAVNYPTLMNIIGKDLFRIYSSAGEDLGVPWDYAHGSGVGNTILEPGDSLYFPCPAFGPAIDIEKWKGDNSDKSLDFAKESSREYLPSGTYYTKFSINLYEDSINANRGEKYVECRKEFKIE